jgi:autotransporter-associated beta strand protein
MLRAATLNWSANATGPAWSVASNWGGVVPGSADVAQFASASYNSQPSLTSTAAVGGIWDTGAGNVTIGGTSALTISSTTINGNNGTGIEVDAGTGSMTINAPLILLNSPQWINNSSGALAVSGNISGSGSLTKIGSGSITLSGSNVFGYSLAVGGGALQIPGGSTTMSSIDVWGGGSYMQSGGASNASSLYLGDNSSNGSYVLSNSGLLTITTAEYIGNSGVGSFTQSGGTNIVSNNFNINPAYFSENDLYIGCSSSGSYALSNSGLLTSPGEYVGYQQGAGSFTQSGGTNNVGPDGLHLGDYSSGTFTLSSSGLLTSSAEYIADSGPGSFTQTGGTNTTSFLSIGSAGRYQWGGGTLQIAGGFANQGVFDGGGGTWSLCGSSSIVDLSHGTLQNVGSMSLVIGPNSLLIVPQGFSAGSVFASFSNSGMIHTAGTPLTVSAGQGFAGWGTIADHVNCQGMIIATSGGAINVNNGLNLSGTGHVDLGSGGLQYSDSISGMSGGALFASVEAASTGTFTQTGGTNMISGELYFENYPSPVAGTYNLFGGLLVVPYINGLGRFNIAGGSLEITPISPNAPVTLADPTILTLSGTLTMICNEPASIDNSFAGAGSLVYTGSSTLELRGYGFRSTFTGGTVVESGTLKLYFAGDLPDGSSLTIGANAMSIFGAPIVDASPNAAAGSSSNAVPEPGTLAILVAAGFVFGVRTVRKEHLHIKAATLPDYPSPRRPPPDARD